MKKKIRDLTISELLKLCEQNKDKCETTCPFNRFICGTRTFSLLHSLEDYELDTEVEIKEIYEIY